MEKYQGRLTRLTWEANARKISTVAVFEGWDAAGKGSAIRRVTAAIDPRLYRIIPIAAPTDEERAHHYFWRFWRHLPQAGYVTIFDRSWYGRVLVERVEKFAAENEWKRAYLEINDFEEQLADRDIALAKFWVHISKEEQLRRFKERKDIEFKRYKITDEDWRNRKKWDAYKEADQRDGGAHQHRIRALDRGARKRQEFRAGADFEDPVRSPGAIALSGWTNRQKFPDRLPAICGAASPRCWWCCPLRLLSEWRPTPRWARTTLPTACWRASSAPSPPACFPRPWAALPG